MDKPVLKPCPFCGGKAEEKTQFGYLENGYCGRYFFIRCKKCSGSSGNKRYKTVAIRIWNRRTDN